MPSARLAFQHLGTAILLPEVLVTAHLRCWKCLGLLLHFVSPVIFELWSPRHDRAGGVCTELAHGPVDDVDAVEEVDHVHGNPVVVFLIVR